MYGLEQNQKEPFTYDLEKEIKNNPKRKKEILDRIQNHENEIKTLLREGNKSKEFKDLETLVHGYGALKKVLNRMDKK